MANTPISGLTAGVAVTDTDLFANDQAVGVGPVKTTALELKTYIGNGLTLTNPILNNPVTIAGVTYTFPLANGPIGSVLTNSGSGALSWTTSALGTVTSVGLDASIVGFTVSNSPVTSNGTLVISGGQLGIAFGGTGASTPAAALLNLLPATNPTTAGYALFNNGAGLFYWAAAGGGGGGGGGNVLSVNTTVAGLSVASPTGNAVIQGTVAIAGGGTGATTVQQATTNLLPAQAGNAGKVLTTNGSGVLSWAAVGTGSVTSVNASGGTTGMTFSGGPVTTSGTLTLGGILGVSNGGTGLSALGTGVQTALGTAVNTNGGMLLAGVGGVLPIAQGGTSANNATTALNNLLPTQTGNAGKVLSTDGSTATWQAASGVSVTSFSAGSTGFLPSTPQTGAIVLSGTLSTANGGTGVNGSAAPQGSLLIGNGSGYTLSTLTAGTGVTITNGAGTITIDATGVAGVSTINFAGTGLTPNTATGGVVNVGGILNNASGGTGLNTSAASNGQLLIGNGTGFTLASITQGTGISITNSAGGITISATGTAGVSTFSGGTTGLTPATATSGAITLGGTLAIANGGTGLSSIGAAGTALVVTGGVLAYGNPNAATNILGGTANQVPYQSGVSTTAFAGPGAAGTYLAGNGAAVAPSFKAATLTLGATALNLNTTTTAITGMTGINMDTLYTPTATQDVATKAYVDANVSAVSRLAPVACVAVSNFPPTGGGTIDGVVLTNGMRVLLSNNTAGATEGIWLVNTAGAWTRPTDANDWAEYVSASVFVTGGTSYANTSWIQTAPAGGTINVTDMTWLQQSGIYNYVAGTGISISGTTINNTGVLSWNGGTTGLTPASATTGAITLAGTLNISNGGTSATTAVGARTNLLPTQTGNNGKYLQTNGTDVVWAASSGGAVYYISVTTGDTIQNKIAGAGLTDAVGNSYVFFNPTGSNVTLTAANLPNYASFSDCTATSLVIYANHTVMVSTTSIVGAGTYAIDASNYSAGNILSTSINASSTMASIITGIAGQVDNEGDIYVIYNNSNAASVISATINNSGSFPGFATAGGFTIPAYGIAEVLTTLANTNYTVISISNSVSTNLSGGAANKIVYQTGANSTSFLPTGSTGQVLLSNGSGAAPSWGSAAAAHVIPVSSNGTISAKIGAVPLTDVVGAVYVFFNGSNAPVTLTTGVVSNTASWPSYSTSSSITLQTNQTITVTTEVVGTNYAIVSVSDTSNVYTATYNSNITVSTELAAAGIVEKPGMLIALTNNEYLMESLSVFATSFINGAAYATAFSSTQANTRSGSTLTLLVVAPGEYVIVEYDASTTHLIRMDVNYDMSNYLPITIVGDQVYMLNQGLNDITLTSVVFNGSNNYPNNFGNSGTTFRMSPGSVLALTLNSAAGDWNVISYASAGDVPSYFCNYTISGSLTIPALLAANDLTDGVGTIYTFLNNSGGPISLTANNLYCRDSFPQNIGAGSSTIIYPNQTLVFSTRVVGQDYVLMSISPAINITTCEVSANSTVPAILVASGVTEIKNTVFNIVNTSSSAAISITANSTFSGFASFAPAATASTVTLQPNGILQIYCVTPSSGGTAGVYRILDVINQANSTFNITANQTLSNYAGAGAMVGDTATFTNTSTAAVALTAAALTNYLTYPGYATATVFTLPADGTVTLELEATTNNWRIINFNAPSGIGSVAFNVTGTNTGIEVQPQGTYPANVMKLTNVTLNPQNYYDSNSGRFTPKVAGYYQVNAYAYNSGAYAYLWAGIYKNGVAAFVDTASNTTGYGTSLAVGGVIYMNGSTDFLELNAYWGAIAGGTSAAPKFYSVNSGWSAALTNAATSAATKVVGVNAAATVGKTTSQALSAAVTTKITFAAPSTQNDPQSWWDATNNRFIPKIAGYYQVSTNLNMNGIAGGLTAVNIRKNGTDYISSNFESTYNLTGSQYPGASTSVVVYMNGTTDYVEVLGSCSGGGNTYGNDNAVNFSIALVGANQAVAAVEQTRVVSGAFATAAASTITLDNYTMYMSGSVVYIKTVSGSQTITGGVWSVAGGSSTGVTSWVNAAVTTSGLVIWGPAVAGQIQQANFIDNSGRTYRMTCVIGPSFNNNLLTIERLATAGN